VAASTPPPRPYAFDSLAGGGATAAKAPVPISAGQQPVSVTLDVVWALQ
jgi:uncharacterized protein YggE